MTSSVARHQVRMPEAPAMVAGLRSAVLISSDGEIETLSHAEAAKRVNEGPPPIVCHAPMTARRIKVGGLVAHDLLELFAFVFPARFCLPTPRGIAEALDLPIPVTVEQQVESLLTATHRLLECLRETGGDAAKIAWAMAMGGWPWGTAVLAALGVAETPHSRSMAGGLRIWLGMKEWTDRPPEAPAGQWPVEPVEARGRLVRLLGAGAEDRPQQIEYTSAVSAAFRPRDKAGEPHFVLAEAGTGVGKTLGYLAPASVWAEKNGASVWVSTFTRNLQRQLDAELDRLFPDPAEKSRKVVIRKGRENYFCLLNFDEAVSRIPVRGGPDAVPLGLMARWASATRDGDMVGGDFPAWLAELVGARLTTDLTDTRGECIYSACAHFRKCFVERSIRRARRAEIVVANHALVLLQAALGGGEDAGLPSRYVFDEGHHLFDAADAAFSAHLTGWEAADLRRWLLGAEMRGRSRSRGLKSRVEDLIADDRDAGEALDAILAGARILPGTGWRQRLAGGTPQGPVEAFLALVRQQVLARDSGGGANYGLEAHPQPTIPGLIEAAQELDIALARIVGPMRALIGRLAALLDNNSDELEAASRGRIESVCRSLERRGIGALDAWRAMIATLDQESAPDFVDWFALDRTEGREIDVGMHRHWIDPMQPFAAIVAEPAHGLLVTSASLRDAAGDADTGWEAAGIRAGIPHLQASVEMSATVSPFDYPAQTRVFVIGDVERNDTAQVAAAYRELFLAAGGGGLGLFTAIARLRDVYGRIVEPLDESGIPLLSQHIDRMDTGTLIDIFRAEEKACLLGTDAVRDGVDVPGASLRLIVFDRVPWPRPTILHRARKEAFQGRDYDGMLTRLRLKQAYGRLIRRASDRGIFVMLDRAMPSRFATAFPDGVRIERMGLAQAVGLVRDFLRSGNKI
ncbi:MAG: ATP-dependent DNA helicase [Rhodospirillales bacterium]|nr:ATP-dependent DNA helicase [Rhodospirillales bacterium]